MKKLLLIDDHASIRKNLKYLIEEKGYDFYEASSVKEARALIKDQDFDVIILDLWMPGENGLVFIKEEHENLKEQNIPVIAYTAFADHSFSSEYEDQFAAILQKPVDVDVLFDTIDMALKESQK
jgi:two-component system nitrogen regulation response regulator NtrX